MEDPTRLVSWVTQSFLRTTLTVLRLYNLSNVPLALLSACPNLRDIYVDYCDVDRSSKGNNGTGSDVDREQPTQSIQTLDYRHSRRLVRALLQWPTRGSWFSNLQVLRTCSDELESLELAKALIQEASSLKQLLLTHRNGSFTWKGTYIPLSKFLNLGSLPSLRVFAAFIQIKERERHSSVNRTVIRDIAQVLSTIPSESNNISRLSLTLRAEGFHPFQCTRDQDWEGLCNEVARIAVPTRQLQFEFELLAVDPDPFRIPVSGGEELRRYIMDQIGTRLKDKDHVLVKFAVPSFSY
ncbi:hypothetical protein CC1G_14325 [Coprinopsis cinerea okayama7|uniref:F-box domain-containing protein n=1 Tax=Coprinopsis cinerea (strain Okayama-7 / 130 / ATCC MYA-4618 / FGSC 9003) TaxID=240176 RepID=D6RLZ7_COPC7|nr:hypothetical protein CC1G_14325 [Coprinopsis cinerea okayama7\|eukprot:XP_002911330.1 hypothetical protein CC1G_14325 [Coprinopsis cinerea okayama7\